MAMKKHNKKDPRCFVENTIGVIGGKWTVLIVKELLEGKKRFGELSRALTGISPRTLSLRLSELESDGVVSKKIFPEVPLHVEYTLTRQGLALVAILNQMHKWGEKYKRK